MIRLLTALLFTIYPMASLAQPATEPAYADEIRAIYLSFADAQNERDVERVGAHYIEGPEFLWVSDGKSFGGGETMLARMSQFQNAEVWRVEPEMTASQVVALGAGTAMMHLPLTLVIGKEVNPNRLRFLVSILFIKPDTTDSKSNWRIAALLTTREKP